MADYIRAELYKVTSRKYLYGTLGGLAALELLLVVLWAWLERSAEGVVNMNGAEGFTMLIGMLSVGFYAALLTSDMVFSEQYKHNTLKNEVSFGLSRTRVYLGKLAVEMAVSLALCVLAVVWYGALCRLLLPAGGDWGAALAQVGFALLAALPVWLGCLALINMLFFLLASTTAASFIAVGLIAVAPSVLELMSALVSDKFMLLHSVLLTTPISNITRHIGDWGTMGRAWAVGLGWFAVTTVLGWAAFRKKEIS